MGWAAWVGPILIVGGPLTLEAWHFHMLCLFGLPSNPARAPSQKWQVSCLTGQ